MATSLTALIACSGRGGSPVPTRLAHNVTKHVSTCDFNAGSTCDFPSPDPTPNLIPQYVDPEGRACDPSVVVYYLTGSPVPCGRNPAYDDTTQSPAHTGIDLSNYQPQCTDIYGSVMNFASFHQCYKMRLWIN